MKIFEVKLSLKNPRTSNFNRRAPEAELTTIATLMYEKKLIKWDFWYYYTSVLLRIEMCKCVCVYILYRAHKSVGKSNRGPLLSGDDDVVYIKNGEKKDITMTVLGWPNAFLPSTHTSQGLTFHCQTEDFHIWWSTNLDLYFFDAQTGILHYFTYYVWNK